MAGDFCDFVAFYFAFEQPVARNLMVCQRVESVQETAVSYRISGDGQIFIDPWPFAVPELSGMIIGFQADEYPKVLQPLIVSFRVTGK